MARQKQARCAVYQRFGRDRKSKGWYFKFRDPLTGQWREKHGGSTRAACKTTRTRLEHSLLSGKYVGGSESLIGFCVKTYLPEQQGRLSRKSYKREQGIVKNHVGRLLDMDIHLITEERVSQYKTRRLEEKGGSPDTVHKELRVLSHIFSKAVDYGRASRNPVDKVELPKQTPGRVRYLSREEMHAWPNVLKVLPEQMRPIVSLMQHTALRRGEAVRLLWADIDLVHELLIVRKDKRGKAKILPLSSPALEILKAQPRINELVFPCVNEDYLTQCFHQATRAAGIINFRLHDLRHNFASHLAMAGTDILTLRDLLGHSDTRMTSRYSHLTAAHLKRAVDKLPEIFEQLADGDENKETIN